VEAAPQPSKPIAPQTGAAVPRGRRWRLVLAVAAGVVALLCLGGAGVAFVVYDNATEIDRSTPDQVVSSYLRASLVQRDDAQAQLYVCNDADPLSDVAVLRSEMRQREEKFNVEVSVNWGPLTRTSQGDRQELVRTQLTIAGFSGGQPRSSRTETWEFRTVDNGGWRVCGGRRVN
jgi:hypothetical protein